jgi:hypothetical protein
MSQTERRAQAKKSEMVAMLARIAARKPEYGDHDDLAELVSQLLDGMDANVVLGLKLGRAGAPLNEAEDFKRIRAMFRMAVLVRSGISPDRAATQLSDECVAPKDTLLNHWYGKGKPLKSGQRPTRWREQGERWADAREDFVSDPPKN